jgi:hypothetical protein
MQTVDEHVLANVDRENIRMSEYKKAIAFYHAERIPVTTDLLLGLPGRTLETCKKDLQFVFDHKVLGMVFAVSVMPNAPMADREYRKKFKIEVDEYDMVEATYSFTREDYYRMFELCIAYKLFVKIRVLKYLLYFVQVEHGVRAIDFISKWVDRVQAAPELYPVSARVRSTWSAAASTSV